MTEVKLTWKSCLIGEETTQRDSFYLTYIFHIFILIAKRHLGWNEKYVSNHMCRTHGDKNLKL